jgi:hypothetical protein
MFFKKGLRDPTLIQKLTMKNPITSEVMLAITNRYALAEEVTLDTREQMKEKDSGHVDQTSSSKGTTRRAKRIIPAMWWNGRDATRSTGPSRGNLKAS